MKAWYSLFAVVAASVFAYLTFGHITEMPIQKDAAENTLAAYNLAHAGVMSIDRLKTGGPAPQMKREPVPILVNTGFLLLHPAFDQPYTITDLTGGHLTKTFKGVNAFWRFLAAIFVFLLCLELFIDRRLAVAMAVICVIVSEFFFFSNSGIVDRMYTELPEVAFMLLAAWCAVRFVRSETKVRALWLGIALGTLALTKGSFLYIGIGFIFLLLAVEGITRYRTQRKERSGHTLLASYAVIAVAMFGTVAPWIVRNYVEFRNPQIASGTEGSVVGIRMLIAEQPLIGAFYFFSPSTIRTIVGPLTGYTKNDLLPGGRLEQLATLKVDKWEIASGRAQAEGYNGPRDAWLKQAAFEAAMRNPLRYIASTAVFAYKGAWFMKRAGALFNLVAVMCFFGVFFGALLTGNRVLVAAFGLPAGLFFFISIFTHALTRYSSPITPFVILALLWLLATLSRRVYRHLEIRPRPARENLWLPRRNAKIPSTTSKAIAPRR